MLTSFQVVVRHCHDHCRGTASPPLRPSVRSPLQAVSPNWVLLPLPARAALCKHQSPLLRLRDEGLLSFWKGNVPQLLRIFPYSAAQLTANDQYKRLLAGWAAGSRSGAGADSDQVRKRTLVGPSWRIAASIARRSQASHARARWRPSCEARPLCEGSRSTGSCHMRT